MIYYFKTGLSKQLAAMKPPETSILGEPSWLTLTSAYGTRGGQKESVYGIGLAMRNSSKQQCKLKVIINVNWIISSPKYKIKSPSIQFPTWGSILDEATWSKPNFWYEFYWISFEEGRLPNPVNKEISGHQSAASTSSIHSILEYFPSSSTKTACLN